MSQSWPRRPDAATFQEERNPRLMPEPAPATSDDALMGRRMEAMARSHSWAGPDRRCRVFTVGAQPVQLVTYDPNRLHMRIACLSTSPDPVAVGADRVTYPLADTSPGDVQPSGGEIIAAGQAVDYWEHEAPARCSAVAAEGTTALVAVTEFIRAPSVV